MSLLGGNKLNVTLLNTIPAPATNRAPINTAVIPTSHSFLIECLAQCIGHVIACAILASTLEATSRTPSSPICFLPSSSTLANNGIKTRATTRLISNEVIIVIGIARMKLPSTPLRNASGKKLSAATLVAATMALLILPTA